MRTTPHTLRIRILTLCVSRLLVATASADTLTFTTAESPFNPGALNQGWWLETSGVNNTGNDNILTGNFAGQEYRSFYTYDRSSSLIAGHQVIGAKLQIQRFVKVSDATTETLAFFDVSTDAVTLNNITGTNAATFAD